MPQGGAHPAEGRSERIGNYITEGFVTFPLSDLVLLCDTVAKNRYIAHRLHHIGEGFLHAAVIIEAPDQDRSHDQHRHGKHHAWSLRLT